MHRRTFLKSLTPALAPVPFALAQHGPGPAGTPPAVIGVIEYGQSNSEGQAMSSAEALRIDYPPSLRMPQTAAENIWMGHATVGGRSFEIAPDAVTGLMPLRGALGTRTHGTTAGESMVLRLVAPGGGQGEGPCGEHVLFNVAEGGQRIRNLASTAPAGYYGFINLVRVATAVNAALQAEGKRYVVRVVVMAQGESDAGQGLLGDLQEGVRAEIDTAIRAITGQAEPVWLLTCQPSSFQASSAGARSILARNERTLALGGAFFCLGPTYNFPWAYDELHHTSVGHDMRGELYAVAYESLLKTGRWDVLRGVAASVTGEHEVKVELSEPAVEEHAFADLPPAHLGVTLGGADIASVRVAGRHLFIATVQQAAAVTAVRLGLAGHGAARTPETIPRTSIRSAAVYGHYRSGAPIHKWLCHQELPIATVPA